MKDVLLVFLVMLGTERVFAAMEVKPATTARAQAAPAVLNSTDVPKTLVLKNHWHIQNSALVAQDGAAVSRAAFDVRTWTQATVPSTVLANLAGPHVGAGTPDDPFYSNQWLKLPGSDPSYYTIGKNFGEVVTPPQSPFGHPWWYRRSFSISSDDLKSFADLNLKGITYGAEIWVNGVRLADPSTTRGSYRQFKYDVTPLLNVGVNTLAVLVSPPLPTDLSPSWVDWNLTPQDKNMGLWREVFIRFHGSVSVRRVFVASDVHLTDLKQADLTIESEIANSTDQPVAGTLHAQTHGFELSLPLTLNARETRQISMTPTQFAQLKIKNPRLWWPWQMGRADLHLVKVWFSVGDTVTDEVTQRFGIRKVESHVTPEGSRLFIINGKPLFIRGGGWASDLLLRFDSLREERELNYVRMLGLNTVRLEGRFEPESFMDLADQKGLLLMPGWVCCNAWQNEASWTPEHQSIARASLIDQLFELRSHPSVFVFLYGSDETPSPAVEAFYLDSLNETHWPNPTLASASDRTSLQGRTGVKMTGPYAYTPPSYWYVDKNTYGGAWGFNTETSPGVSMPPIESLQQFIPKDHFLKVDELWNFHMGENEFATLALHQAAVDRRYGETKDAIDLVKKSQVMDYDNHRAMFEAYAHNKYHSATGVVQWMLNSAWPSIMWHLYDYYLRPNAAFYAVKKANAPLHISLNPDDLTVSLVNSTYRDVAGLQVSVKMVDLKSQVFFATSRAASMRADSAEQIMKLPSPSTPDRNVYFVQAELRNQAGGLVDTNFYWLSLKEVYDWEKTDFKQTPIDEEADFSALEDLPATTLKVSLKPTGTSTVNSKEALVTIKNTGKNLAFFVHLKLQAGAKEILPVDWGDNDISLLPGESRQIKVRAPDRANFKGALNLHGSGWNVEPW